MQGRSSLKPLPVLETPPLKSDDFVSLGGSDGHFANKRHRPSEEFKPQGVTGEPASKFSTRNYGPPDKEIHYSLSSSRVVRADGGSERVTDGTKSIEKTGNTSSQLLIETQLKRRSKATGNVDLIGIGSKSMLGEKSTSSKSHDTLRSTADHVKSRRVASVGGHEPSKSTAKVEVGKGHHSRFEQIRPSKPASSGTGRLDRSKQH